MAQKMQVVKKPYSFTNDAGKLVEGKNYFLQVQTPYGPADFKIVAKADLEKQALEQLMQEQHND